MNHSAAAVLDFDLWLRFLVGFAVIVWLPGHLWVGRHLPGRRWPVRLLLTVGCGLLMIALYGQVASAVGPWLRWWVYLPIACGLGLVAGRRPAYRRLVEDGLPAPVRAAGTASGPLPRYLAGLASLVMAALVVSATGQMAVPLGDGANHAFLTARIVQEHSLRQEAVFAAPFGNPGFVYLMGWHAAAAMISQAMGLPAYVSSWLLPLLLLFMLPAGFALLWRVLGFSPQAAAWGAVFLVCNKSFPAGVLGWGGFGSLVGWFLVPTVVVILRRAVVTGRVLAGIFAGLTLVAMIQIHASEIVASVVLAVLAVRTARRRGIAGPWDLRTLGAAGAVFAVGAAWAVAGAGPAYLTDALMDTTPVAAPWAALGRALDGLNRSGWAWGPFRLLVVLAFAEGLRRRRIRPATSCALLAGLLFLWVSTSRDPVGLALSRPWYGEPSRVLALQIYFLPPLMGLVVERAWRWAASPVEGRASIRRPLVWLATAVLVLPGLHSVFTELVAQKRNACFTAADIAHAERLPDAVPAGAVIANLTGDGSQWAWHFSGRDFLAPATWPLRTPGEPQREGAVLGFARPDWPPETLGLRARGVEFLYLSDTWDLRFVESPAVTEQLPRRACDRDDRFEPVCVGENATVYRIHWLPADPSLEP